MNPAWYENFFEDIVVEMWRKAVTPEQTRLEVEFLRRALKLELGHRVLDVPCGFGRHALELTRSGFQVTGVDGSPEMVQEAMQNAEAAGLDVEWRIAEMRELGYTSAFDAAFSFGNSFGYLDADGTQAFLRAVSAALRPGARFALDYGLAAECILPRFAERQWAQVEDILFLEENHYNAVESCVETSYTFVRNGKTTTKTGWQWVYTVGEVRKFLLDAGLRTEAAYRSLDGEPFEVGSPLLILVAQKI